jgi:hypothetical protein
MIPLELHIHVFSYNTHMIIAITKGLMKNFMNAHVKCKVIDINFPHHRS